MNNRFDELTKNMAQSVTRRTALKRFGLGLAGMALACIGLAPKASAKYPPCRRSGAPCKDHWECCSKYCDGTFFGGKGTAIKRTMRANAQPPCQRKIFARFEDRIVHPERRCSC